MRLLRRTSLVAALGAALLALPSPAAGAAVASPEAELAAATAEAGRLSAALEQAAARDGGLRVALERLEEEHALARARLGARVRQVFIARRPDPLGGLTTDLAAPALRRLADRGAAAAVRVDRELVDAVAQQSTDAVALRARAAGFRFQLRAQAAQALRAQERARRLLAEAEAELARRQAAAAAAAVAGPAVGAAASRPPVAATPPSRLVAQSARLAAARDALDVASAVVTTALTPAQTRRSRRAQQAEAPVVALVEAAGAGYPRGYAATGQVLAGLASWYGPGFVGSPTASGAPYDPERLTCAHKTLPLGTVVRVSAHGRTVSCLVNDRGPYTGARILDMSRAGSRALGYDGVARVVVEVLAPQ